MQRRRRLGSGSTQRSRLKPRQKIRANSAPLHKNSNNSNSCPGLELQPHRQEGQRGKWECNLTSPFDGVVRSLPAGDFPDGLPIFCFGLEGGMMKGRCCQSPSRGPVLSGSSARGNPEIGISRWVGRLRLAHPRGGQKKKCFVKCSEVRNIFGGALCPSQSGPMNKHIVKHIVVCLKCLKFVWSCLFVCLFVCGFICRGSRD